MICPYNPKVSKNDLEEFEKRCQQALQNYQPLPGSSQGNDSTTGLGGSGIRDSTFIYNNGKNW